MTTLEFDLFWDGSVSLECASWIDLNEFFATINNLKSDMLTFKPAQHWV